MGITELPGSAAWRHRDARDGFESVFLRAGPPGYRIDGYTAAVEDGRVWAVRYLIELDESWVTRSARAWGRSLDGETEVRLDVNDSGRWHVNGTARPDLDGCHDVDLESSAGTNTIPVHRLDLGVGQSAEAPAAYVRVRDLGVERLEQQYSRVDDDGWNRNYDYRCPAFDVECRLVYDDAGLVVEYPGIALRAF